MSFSKARATAIPKSYRDLKPNQHRPNHSLDPHILRKSNVLIFKNQMSKNIFLNISTLEDKNTTKPQNIRIPVSSDTASYPSRIKSCDIPVGAPAAFTTFTPSSQSV
jgi:hypothetical protein